MLHYWVINLCLQTFLNCIKFFEIKLLKVTILIHEIRTHNLFELNLITIVLVAFAELPNEFKSFDALLEVAVHDIFIGGDLLNHFAATFQILLPVLDIFQPFITIDEQEH